MEKVLFILLSGVLGVWVYFALDLCLGVLFRIPVLKKSEKTADGPRLETAPKVSVIFAARNEECKIAAALKSLLKQDCADYEVIAVNDRSSDRTADILAGFSGDSRFRMLTVEQLPEGWLGKNHALYQGYLQSRGEWLLFTDADVVFEKEAVRRAVEFARREKADHLALLPKLITRGLLEKMFTTAFGIAFYLHFRPWAAANPRSRAHVGVGAFNLVSRSRYEKLGTHESFRLNVLDDMELGRRVKLSGGSQKAVFGHELISVAWAEGWQGILKSLEKNGFAGFNYNLIYFLGMILGALLLNVLPWAGALFCQGPARAAALGSAAAVFLIYLALQRHHSKTLLVFLFHPIGCLLMLGIVARSAWLTLKRGGIQWRDTFYPLKDLKASLSLPDSV